MGASGDMPWTELMEDYTDLRSTPFCVPLRAIQMGLAMQGILKLRRNNKFEFKNLFALRAVEATSLHACKQSYDAAQPNTKEPVLL